MADRYDAEIDGYAIDVETLADGFDKAIVRTEYPWRDGAETEDMGQLARTLRLRCYWLEERYDEHFHFLEHLKSRELFELSHPKYGLLKGRVESVRVRHDERVDTAEVDIDFVEDLLSQEEPAIYIDVAGAAEEAFMTGQGELADYFSRQSEAALGVEARWILAKELDPALGIVAQFGTVSTRARNWLQGVEATVDHWQARLVDVANPANSLLSTISYGTQLPGRVIGALARTVERYARLRDSLVSAPERFIDGLRNGLAELRDVSEDLVGAARIAGAQRIGLETGILYRDDETRRNALRRSEEHPTFDTAGRYRGGVETVEPVMTARTLERSLAAVRAEIQAGVDVDRHQRALKQMAAALLDHVTVIKLERDRIARITLDNAMPLHMVCLHRGLPYRYAERILAINQIKHPTFVDGKVDVYVR